MIELLKGIIFYPLYWLRPILKGGLSVVSTLFAFVAVIAGLGSCTSHTSSTTTASAIVAGILSFVSFLIGQIYDYILMKTCPKHKDLILYE